MKVAENLNARNSDNEVAFEESFVDPVVLSTACLSSQNAGMNSISTPSNSYPIIPTLLSPRQLGMSGTRDMSWHIQRYLLYLLPVLFFLLLLPYLGVPLVRQGWHVPDSDGANPAYPFKMETPFYTDLQDIQVDRHGLMESITILPYCMLSLAPNDKELFTGLDLNCYSSYPSSRRLY